MPAHLVCSVHGHVIALRWRVCKRTIAKVDGKLAVARERWRQVRCRYVAKCDAVRISEAAVGRDAEDDGTWGAHVEGEAYDVAHTPLAPERFAFSSGPQHHLTAIYSPGACVVTHTFCTTLLQLKTFGAKSKLAAAHDDDADFKVEAAATELHIGNKRVEAVKMHHVLHQHVAAGLMTHDHDASRSSMRLRSR